MLTPQEILDKVVHHLKTDGRPSYVQEPGGPRCLYRGPNGTRCFVGALIPDENYTPSLENLGVGCSIVLKSVGCDLEQVWLDGGGTFLCGLQPIHDSTIRNNNLSLERGEVTLIELVRPTLDALAKAHSLTINWE